MDIYQKIVEKKSAGVAFVVATIVRIEGSSPRDVGAKMLVFADGSIWGTIGGGMFEKLVIDDCLGLLGENTNNLLKTYRFAESGPDATGMYCGGEAEVFMEANRSPERLIIFGGGHIGRDLAKIAQGIDFKIIVVDDRPEILSEYHSPVETILTDAVYHKNFPAIDKNSYVVIITHGHKCDREVLEQVINQECAYIGMIGSRTKIAKTFSELEKAGIDRIRLEHVYSPIGLDIGAEGPYEIAIAIAAELIAVKKKAPKPSN
jgi:xanthine dehydrogenase accessory factor